MSFLLADKVLFSKMKVLPGEECKLRGKIVAMVNPYDMN